MKVLVTGGCGVIGSLCARQWLSQGHVVRIVDHCEEPRNLYLKKIVEDAGAKVIAERIEQIDSHEWWGVLEDFDLVLHAAAFTGIPSSAENPHDDWVSNVDVTRVFLEGLRMASKKPHMVVLSSVKPYDLSHIVTLEKETRYDFFEVGTGESSIDERWPLSPDEPYAASKMAQSAICQAYARSYDLPITIFRCSNLYGPAPSHGPRHGWLTWFAISAAIGRPLIVQGNGKQTRDMLHADDVWSAVMTAFENPSKTQGELFNLGGGQENTISVMEAAAKLRELSGCEIQSAPGRQHEDPIFVTDYSKFNQATWWKPQVPVGPALTNDCDLPEAYRGGGLEQLYRWAVENKADLIPLYEGL